MSPRLPHCLEQRTECVWDLSIKLSEYSCQSVSLFSFPISIWVRGTDFRWLINPGFSSCCILSYTYLSAFPWETDVWNSFSVICFIQTVCWAHVTLGMVVYHVQVFCVFAWVCEHRSSDDQGFLLNEILTWAHNGRQDGPLLRHWCHFLLLRLVCRCKRKTCERHAACCQHVFLHITIF